MRSDEDFLYTANEVKVIASQWQSAIDAYRNSNGRNKKTGAKYGMITQLFCPGCCRTAFTGRHVSLLSDVVKAHLAHARDPVPWPTIRCPVCGNDINFMADTSVEQDRDNVSTIVRSIPAVGIAIHLFCLHYSRSGRPTFRSDDGEPLPTDFGVWVVKDVSDDGIILVPLLPNRRLANNGSARFNRSAFLTGNIRWYPASAGEEVEVISSLLTGAFDTNAFCYRWAQVQKPQTKKIII